MHLVNFAVVLWSLFTMTNAAPADDMESLAASCENAATVLNTSLNNTMAMNTSDIVQSIGWQLGASSANLSANSSIVNSTNTSLTLDAPYFDYIDAVRTLTEAVIRRGLVFHQETNLPVYNALKAFAVAVQVYGMELRDAGVITQDAIIRTFTAGSSLADAEAVWADTPSASRRRQRAVRS